jgi:hypothetical protein
MQRKRWMTALSDFAKEANPREAGLLFYVTSAASNVGEALALFGPYSRIVNEAVRIKRDCHVNLAPAERESKGSALVQAAVAARQF